MNQGPSDLQSDALPTELSRLIHSAAIHLNNKTMFRHIHKVHRGLRIEEEGMILWLFVPTSIVSDPFFYCSFSYTDEERIKNPIFSAYVLNE